MRTIHYGLGVLPTVSAGELVDDFGNAIEWDRVNDVIQWPGVAAWHAAFEFKNSGLDAA